MKHLTQASKTLALISLLCLVLAPTARAQDITQYIGQGNEYLRNNMFSQAKIEFEKALRLEPANVAAARGLGQAAMQLQDWVAAKRGLDIAHQQSPGDCGVTKNLAYVLMRMKMTGRAMAAYEEIVGSPGKPGCDPDDNNSKSNLGSLYLRGNESQKAKAIQLFNQVINSGEDDPDLMARTHYSLGNLYLMRKNYDLAIQHMESAFALDPERTDGRYNLGKLYFNKQEYDKALQHLTVALTGKENDYNINLMLGLCYNEMDGFENEAVQHLSKAVNLIKLMDAANRPSRNLPHAYLARLYNNLGEPERALQISNEGLELAGTDTERAGLNCTKAKAYELLGDYERALDLFEDAVDDPVWGNYASKQAERQENLIRIKEAREGQ
jgi:tetratricopeptide (TPR) repeat protein